MQSKLVSRKVLTLQASDLLVKHGHSQPIMFRASYCTCQEHYALCPLLRTTASHTPAWKQVVKLKLISLYTHFQCDETYIVCKHITRYTYNHLIWPPINHHTRTHHMIIYVNQDKYSKVREKEKRNSEKNFAVFHIFVRHCLRS